MRLPSIPIVAAALALAAPPARAQIVQPTQSAARPPPIPDQPGCSLWRGLEHGNDPSAELDIRVCIRGDAVTGYVQWSSLRSGWTEKDLVGQVTNGGKSLVLHDTRFVKYQPQPGWRFCLADRYDLDFTAPDRLDGTFDSASCHDHADVHLARLDSDPGNVPAVAPPPPPAPPPAPLAPHNPLRRRACSCELAGGDAGSAAAALSAAGVLGLARMRRRGRRTEPSK